MKRLFVVGGGILVLCIVIIIAIVLSQKDADSSQSDKYSGSYFTSCDNPTRSSEFGRYSTAAASSDAAPCGSIAIDILNKNGTAADAAIAAMFCVGVINAQSGGLGGGFLATYYSKEHGRAYALDAREVAPKAATQTMYNPSINRQLQGKHDKWYENLDANTKGGLAVAVPGESAGLYELYNRFGGGVPWKDLIEPTIKICEEGYNLTWYTGGIMYPMRASILAEPSMRILTNQTEERTLHEGETVFRPQLAKTLRILQEEPLALHNGSLVDNFVSDLAQFGGIITEEDMKDYRPIWREPVHFHLKNGNYSLHSFPPPGAGLIFGLILNILDGFHLTKSSLEGDELFRTHQLVAEAMKFAYARRFQMGDLSEEEQETISKVLSSREFSARIKTLIKDQTTNNNPVFYGTGVVPPEDEGTAHFSLIAPNGDAVAITSSINHVYGAGIRSESTGIIYNNEMGDFTTDIEYLKPGSMKMDKNLIVPGRRPLSSMCPSIFIDANGDVKLVVGAAGGIKIPSAAAWVAARFLWMGQDLKKSVDECRTHHSLLPMKLQYETGFPKSVLDSLKQKGHEVMDYIWKSVVIAVGRSRDQIVANADYRKSGEIAGF